MEPLSQKERYFKTLAGEWDLIHDPGSLRTLAGKWDLISRQPVSRDCSALWFIPIVTAFFGSIGTWLWTKLTEAKTDSERENVKADAYEAYTRGEIDRDLYESILMYSGESTWSATFNYIAKKYGFYILGVTGLIILLLVMKKK